ncbi:1d9e841f-50e3-4100-93be-a38953554741-CDS [Sclerotinia trifoliorum]|uniref:1d9e841f-50e3-4100-93be-a38953554741-CDS n=1 Tax=Sclerotinia trifoliorum TaxID=28548 RepID=A0A8H2W3Q7_9HELO|nr:1d9e841f-50e3-4100-93be-a38953554741-CDS [Sclerotinia trifoliorum]
MPSSTEAIITELTPIDHLMPRTYVISFNCGWPISRRSKIEDIYNHLKLGLKRTLNEIPFLGGTVVSTGSPGKFQIETLPSDLEGNQLIFNDLRTGSGNSWPHSYKSLRKARFPGNVFFDDCLSPVKGYMGLEKLPVIAAQANFIDGGLILHLSVLHTACDVLAWNNVLFVLSKNVKASWPAEDEEAASEKLKDFEVLPSYLDRSPLMHGTTNLERMDIREYKLQVANSTLEDPRNHLIDSPPKSTTEMANALFCISTAKLEVLRDAVSREGSAKSWLTVNDTLAALIWCCVNRARISIQGPLRGNLSVAYEGRTVLDPPLPKRYMGNASLGFPITLDIHPRSIFDAALAISESRTEFTDKHIRDMTGFLDSLGDITEERVSYVKTLNPILVISNLKDIEGFEQDWGGNLGFQDAARMANPFLDCTPRVLPMPAQRDGNVDIIVWIEKSAVERLKEDEMWNKWITPVNI